ncbi:MAG: prepilin-type N-terminal cleavage/methylation domain-containing protein [Pseudoxanthomonas sp.]
MSRNARGFTLIEVLLATVLLAAGLALAFATLRSATAMAQRGETIAQRNERMRAVEGFLRRRISSAQPMAFAIDADSQRQYRFVGEANRMRFVADLPDYLGRGGPYLHDLAIADGGAVLLASFSMVQAGQTVRESQPRPPEILADKLGGARFRYRGLDQEGKLGQWQDSWTAAESLPLQVSVEIESADGQAWPGLVVSLAQGSGQDNGLGQGLEPPP